MVMNCHLPDIEQNTARDQKQVILHAMLIDKYEMWVQWNEILALYHHNLKDDWSVNSAHLLASMNVDCFDAKTRCENKIFMFNWD